MRKFFRNVQKLLPKTTSPHSIKSVKDLHRVADLASVREFIDVHEKCVEYGDDVKTKLTRDLRTIDIARSVFTAQKSAEFFENNILFPAHDVGKEIGSIKVILSDLEDSNELKEKYEKGKIAAGGKDSMICIGGPAAQNQVVLAGMIEKIRERLTDITYITRDHKESNEIFSAKQSHARHSNALNADSNLTGHSLMSVIIFRNLMGITVEEALEPDYRKIDVPFTIDPKKLRIYFGNELNYWKQEYLKATGKMTEHDINRIEGMISQEILISIEEQSGVKLTSNVKDALHNPTAIHLALSKKSAKEIASENKELQESGIEVEKMKVEERASLFPRSGVLEAWKYKGDTNLLFDTHEINKEIAQKNGVKWIDGKEIRKILLIKNQEGKAEVAGVLSNEGEFTYANKVHLTGGYKVDLTFDKESNNRFSESGMARRVLNKIEDFLDIQNPLPTDTTVATGLSVNAIFKLNPKMEELLKMQIAITNSHWTMIAKNDEYAVVRMTGGGNAGSEQYNPAYFINLMANTRYIFGDSLVGVVSTYGCPRAINYRNSSEFAEVAEGLVVSYGKGGAGITKGHYEAAQALMMLGFEEEVVEHFNNFRDRKDRPLGDEIAKIYEHAKNVQFIYDDSEKTSRRMGFSDSFSLEEMLVAGLLLAGVTLAIGKKIEKENQSYCDAQKDSPSSSCNPTDVEEAYNFYKFLSH